VLFAVLVPWLFLGQATSAQDATPIEAPIEPVSTEAQVEAAYQRMLAARAEREAELETPAAEAEREASRGAHDELAPAESMALLRDSFEGELRALDADPARALDDTEVERFAGDSAIVVDPGAEGGGKELLLSDVPLRIDTPQGEEAVDLRLDQAGAIREPETAGVPVELPSSLASEFALPGLNVEFDLPGAPAATARTFSEHDLFYPEVGPDTDLLAAPLAEGLEVFFQLRSPEAEAEQRLRFDLPAGAELITTPDGDAEIVRGVERLAFIPAAWARDAQGQDVPVEMTTDGDELVLDVAHRGGDFAYPILVDPPVYDSMSFHQSATRPPELDDWTSHPAVGNTASKFDMRYTCRPNYQCFGGGSGWGLYAYAKPNVSFSDGASAHWHYDAPRPIGLPAEIETTSYVPDVSLRHTYLRMRSTNPRPYLVAAINNRGDGFTAVKTRDVTYSDEQINLRVCDPDIPDDGNGPCRNQDASHIAFGFGGVGAAGAPALPDYRDAYLGGAYVTIRDEHPPSFVGNANTLVSGQTFGQGGWVDQGTYRASGTARDKGIGIRRFEFELRQAGSLLQTGQRNQGCLGERGSRCPYEWSTSQSAAGNFEYSTGSLPNGLVSGTIRAVDALDKTDARDFEVRVDHTKPSVSLAGGLSTQAPQEAPNQNLIVTATDGTRASAVGQSSGVAEIEVKVDGQPLAPRRVVRDGEEQATQSMPVGCPHDAGSCELEAHYKLNLFDVEKDTFQIEVTAKDHVGHPETKTLNVKLAGGPPQIERTVSCLRRAKAVTADPDEPCIDGEQVVECTDQACIDNPAILKCDPDDRQCALGAPSPPGWAKDGERIETAIFGRDVDADKVEGAARAERGIEAAKLFFPTGLAEVKTRSDCAGVDPGCPEYGGLSFEYPADAAHFPEGISKVAARVRNRGGDASAVKRFEVRVDRGGPQLDNARLEASPLYQHRDSLLYPLTYRLDLRGFDGSNTNPALYRSGMKSIEVLVDGRRAYFAGQSCPPPLYSCSLQRSWSLDTAELKSGAHTVTVVLTDQAGNQTSRSITINVRDSLGEPSLGSDRLGLEQYFDYDSTETGLSSANVNLATGNVAYHKVPIVNPGRGLSSVVNLTYNSFDFPVAGTDVPPATDSRFFGLEYDEAGIGQSLGISGVTRVNEPLGGLVSAEGRLIGTPATVSMTDPDGTAHTFTLLRNEDGNSVNDSLYAYRSPAGVNLYLRQYSNIVKDAQGNDLLPEQREKAWAMTRPDGVTYFYDGWGFLRSIVDRNGNEMRYVYEVASLANGALCVPAIVVPGVCEPRLVKVIDAAGNDTGASQALKDQRTLRIEYYPTNLQTPGHAQGKIKRIYEHTAPGQTSSQARVLELGYRAGGYLETLTEAQGTPVARTTRYMYDAPSNATMHPQLVSVSDPNGGEPTEFRYLNQQPAGELGRRPYEVENRANHDHTYSFGTASSTGWDYANVTDALGKTTQHVMDTRDRPIFLNDPLGTQTQLEWDSDNNVIRLTEGVNQASPPGPDAATTRYEYNENGLLTAMTDPLGRTTELAYASGPGLYAAEWGGGPDLDCDEQFVSDLVSITRPEGNRWSFEIAQANNGQCKRLEENGNVTKQTDPLGNAATAAYNARGQITSETNEEGDTTEYAAYEPSGMATEIVAPRGTNATSADGTRAEHRWLYRYDAAGNLLQATDPRGAGAFPGGLGAGVAESSAFTTTLTYDALDRLKAERFPRCTAFGCGSGTGPDFATRNYEYDLNDNRTAVTDAVGSRFEFDFTAMDRLAEERRPGEGAGGGAPTETTRYRFDDEERLIEILSPRTLVETTDIARDHVTRFELDAIGRRVATIRQAAQPGKDLVTSYAYDRRDNVVGVALPSDNTDSSIPGGATVPLSEALANASSRAKQREQRVYDKADQLLASVENPDGVCGTDSEPIRNELRYDLNGNLTRQIGPRAYCGLGNVAAQQTLRTYDERDLLVQTVDPVGSTTNLGYDDAGRLIREERPNGAATSLTGDFSVNYTYDANGDLASRSIPLAEGQYGLAGSDLGSLKVAYERDAVGNPTRITDARGNAFTNSFYDTGELRSTTRPSWWQADWGPAGGLPSAGRRYEAVRSGLVADTQVPLGGPRIGEAPGPEAGGNALGGSQRSSIGVAEPTDGGGDFGETGAEEMPPLIPRAGETHFAYDQEMRLAEVIDQTYLDAWRAGGSRATWRIDYDAQGRISEKTLPFAPGDPIRHSFAYDTAGNLTSFTDGGDAAQTDPSRFSTRFDYDFADRVAQEVAPGSRPNEATGDAQDETTSVNYDPNGNVTALQTARPGLRFEFGYDALDRLIRETNPANEDYHYDHDVSGNIVRETSPRAVDTVFVHDPAARLVSMTEAAGTSDERETTFGYDPNGNQTLIVAPGSTDREGDSYDRIIRQVFDGRDLPWATTIAADTPYERTSITEYDANGNLRRTVNPEGVNASGEPLAADADPQGRQFAGEPTSGASGAARHATVGEYNADNLLRFSHQPWADETPAGIALMSGKDANGIDQRNLNEERWLQRFDYNPRGWIDSITIAYKGTPDEVARTTYSYFDSGWVSAASDPAFTDPETGRRVPDRAISYNYDRRGLQTVWQTAGFNREGASEAKRRKVVQDHYPSGLLAERTGILPDLSNPQFDLKKRSSSYFYNPNRSLVAMVDERYSGDPDNRFGPPERTTEIVRDGAEREVAVDELWRSGRDTTFTYEAGEGLLTKRCVDGDYAPTADANDCDMHGGRRTTFAYDGLGRETSMQVTGDGPTRRWETDYFDAGDASQLRKQTDADPAFEVVESYSWRADGLIDRKVRDPESGPPENPVDYNYDANANRTLDERGEHAFNARDQLVWWDPEQGGAVSYVLDGSGQILEQLDADGDDPDIVNSYVGRRLTKSVTKQQGEPDVRSTYLYDGLGNVAQIKSEIKDGQGQFPPAPEPPTEISICGPDSWDDAGSTYYCYDEFSRLIYTHAPGAAKTDVAEYDGLDRRHAKLTSDEADPIRELSYVGTSQLLSREVREHGDVATYDYDSQGVRRGQSYSPGAGSNVPGGYRSYTTDANGSVVALEDSTGKAEEDYSYDPYGELLDPGTGDRLADPEAELSARAQANPFRFEGFYYDSAVRTYDMQARAYRPETARFLSEDRYADAGLDIALQSDPLTQNRYVFAGGNPVSNVEWDGHCFGKKGGFLTVLCRRALNSLVGKRTSREVRDAFQATPAGQVVSGAVASVNRAVTAPPSVQVASAPIGSQCTADGCGHHTDAGAGYASAYDLQPDLTCGRSVACGVGPSAYEEFNDYFLGAPDFFFGDPAAAVSTLGGPLTKLGCKVAKPACTAAVDVAAGAVKLAAGAASKVLGRSRVSVAARGADDIPPVNWVQQEKHFLGHDRYIAGRSELTADPQRLAQRAGTGQPLNDIPYGQPGFRERIDFGESIGTYVDQVTGIGTPTTRGIVHYGSRGFHVVPARPGL
jgi:RHS repeat-associated protein